MLKILDLIESEIKKAENNFNQFVFWLLTGIEPTSEAESKKVEEGERPVFYGFWKSLYLVIFKKGRIQKK